MAARKLAGMISVKELARQMGVTRATALRRLRAIDKRCGGGVLFRFADGRTSRFFTTLSLLRKADEKLLEDHEVMRSDVDELKARVARHREEIISLRSRVRELENA